MMYKEWLTDCRFHPYYMILNIEKLARYWIIQIPELKDIKNMRLLHFQGSL
jgi:hypothetical protein